MIDLEKIVRKNIINLKPYSSARDEFSGSQGIFLDANENPFGIYNRYPDPHQEKLKKMISDLKNVKPENIFLGNGSDEAIDIVFRIFCEPGSDKTIIFTPTYGMYEVAGGINDVEMHKIPLKKDFQIDLESVKPFLNDKNLKLIFICSPNNPTGNVIENESINFILNNFNGIVIIDEAYNDFSNSDSFIQSINTFNNLIVLQTFSKAWAMAGVRIGMAFSNETIISYFNKVKPPYNISQLNQVAVMNKIGEVTTFKKEVAEILEERELLKNSLQQIKFVKKVYPSDANFFLVEVTDANSIYNQLLDENIIVRNRSGVIPNCLRITIGTKKENQNLLTALKKIEHG